MGVLSGTRSAVLDVRFCGRELHHKRSAPSDMTDPTAVPRALRLSAVTLARSASYLPIVKPYDPAQMGPEQSGHDRVAFNQARTYPTPAAPAASHRGRRALGGALAISAVVVAASLAATNLHDRGQKVTVAPAAAPRSLMLFVANYDASNVVGYPLGGPYRTPKVTLSTDVASPQGLVFDPAGDLWVASASGLTEYARAELTSASPRPKVVVTGGSGLAGLAFDSAGNLWVDDYGANKVYEYAKNQLTRSGDPRPKVTISGETSFTGDVLLQPVGLAFDGAGDLWVGGEGSGQLVEYTKSALTKSGSPAPKVDNSAVPPASHVEDVLFDSAGNLWAAEGDGGSLVEYKKNQLTHPPASPIADVSTSMPPAVSVRWNGMNGPQGLAFDPSGNLWVTDYPAETVLEFTGAQLRKTSSLVPHQTIREASGGPSAVAIGP
jgi:sugar lactone lactonase YvrE